MAWRLQCPRKMISAKRSVKFARFILFSGAALQQRFIFDPLIAKSQCTKPWESLAYVCVGIVPSIVGQS